MARSRWPLAVALTVFLAVETQAQVIIGPPPIVPSGIGFQYGNRHLRVSGFLPTGGYYYPGPVFVGPPYAVSQQRIVIQQINPTVIVKPPPPGIPADEVDLSGIDLDVFPPEKLYGKDAPAFAKKPRPEPEMIARPPAIAEPPPLKKPEPEKTPAPKVTSEAERLIDLGIAAFRKGEYGLATLRFTQATDADPLAGRPRFLLAQALFATGKFRDAVRAIEEGLRLRPDWPRIDFRPKAELYANDEATWELHLLKLDNTLKEQPQDADFLFLRGYLVWFDDRRPEARDFFERARPLVVDPRWIDLFLKKPAVAQK